MKTIEVAVKFADPLHPPTKEECRSIVSGKCPVCSGTTALITSDEFTDFYGCIDCNLYIHSEVLETLLGERVYRYADATKDLFGGLIKKEEEDEPSTVSIV